MPFMFLLQNLSDNFIFTKTIKRRDNDLIYYRMPYHHFRTLYLRIIKCLNLIINLQNRSVFLSIHVTKWKLTQLFGFHYFISHVQFLAFIITFYNINKIKSMKFASNNTNIINNINKNFQEVQYPTLLVKDYKQIKYALNNKGLKKITEYQEIQQESVVYNRSLWSLQQNKTYMEFLLQYEEIFSSPRNQRKSMKINVLLSSAVKTRSPDQCRSHHQKMMKYHRDIPNIVKHISHLINYQEQKVSNNPSAFQQVKKESVTDIVTPQACEWHSWIDHNEAIWEEMMNERWLNGVEDIYGNI